MLEAANYIGNYTNRPITSINNLENLTSENLIFGNNPLRQIKSQKLKQR